MRGLESRQRRPQWAAFVIAAGLAAMALALLMDAAGQKQDGGYAGVGPGDVPRMVAFGLLVLSGLTVVAGFRGELPEPEAQNKGPVLWILTGLGLQLVLLHSAGFAVAGAMLFGFTARGFGKGPLWLTVGVGFFVALGIHGVFDGLLNLNLPAGPVERLVFGG
jgi:putative tricarboxylic transport membrane protein